jgi:hypothetical protein
VFHRLNKAGLGSQPLEYLEMIVYEWSPLTAHDPLINSFVSIDAIVDGSPHEMTLLDACGLIFMLDPVPSAGQCILDSLGIVASIGEIKEEFFFLREFKGV